MYWIFDVQTNKFPANMDLLHSNLLSWILSHVSDISKNVLIVNQGIINQNFNNLKNIMKMPIQNNESAVKKAWDLYFSSFLIGAMFTPATPPPGFLIPGYSCVVLPLTSKFDSRINLVNDEIKIRELKNRYISWIMTQKSIGYWSIPGPSGIMPAPPFTSNLIVT